MDELEHQRRRAEAAERALARARADLAALKATRRYRIGAALARPLDRLRAGRQPRPAPFIVGVPRSGTTLLRLMLNAHPQLAIPPETMFITLLGDLPAAGDVRRAFFDAVTGFDPWPDLGVDDQALWRQLERIEPFELGAAVRAIYRLYAQRFGKPRFGDKTPNYALHMREVAALLPEARFVHIIRDGRDVALSVRPLWFRPGDTIEAIAADWRDRIEAARRAGDARYIELRYEDLVAAPERELRRVCEFVELPFHPDMLRYWETGKLGEEEFRPYTAADGSLLASSEGRRAHFRRTATPPDPERSGRWRTALTEAERETFDRVAGELLRSLGYDA